MLKFVGRWMFRLTIVAIVLVVALLLLKDTIFKSVAEYSIRSQSGLDVRIGKLEVGLLSPTVTLENFRLYNPPEFGGGVFLDIPEVHVEYDAAAMQNQKLKFKLIRFNLAELNLVESKTGVKSADVIQKQLEKSRIEREKQGKPSPKFDFGGIETLNLTLGRVRNTSQRSPQSNFDRDLGVRNLVVTNIQSERDLQVILVNLALRQGLGILLEGGLQQMIAPTLMPVPATNRPVAPTAPVPAPVPVRPSNR